MSKYVLDKVKNLKPSGIRKFFDYASKYPDAIALSVGEPDFDTPWHISEEGIYSIEKGYTFYTSNAGLVELRNEICKFLNKKYALKYENNEVIVTIGGSEAIDASLRALVTTGDEVILTDPGYVSYEPCVLLTGATPVHYILEEKDDFKVKKEKLLSLITPRTKVLLINYPNNPTGGVMSKEDLLEIAEVCKEKDIFVISDEIYSELTYGKEKHASIASIEGMKERCIVINGFSKTYSMTGWRIGYLVGPYEVVSQIYKIHQYGIMCASTASQYAALEALRNGEKDIVMMRNEYERRRNFVVSRLHELGLDCYEPKGAFYFFINVSKFGMTSEEFCINLLKEQEVIVIPGSAFGESGEGFIRISYAYSLDELKEALNRIEKFIKKY